MRALITGGGGFVGHWLAAHLREEGDHVVAIDREVEITDPAAVSVAVAAAAPDAIYHLAALSHVGQSWEAPLEVLRVNVLGTAAVLEAAVRCATAPRVLVTSSAEVYGTVTDPALLPLDETAPTAPVTPYAASKLAAEAVVSQAFHGRGLPVVTVRPFNHVGPGQSDQFAVAALARRIVEADARGEGAIPVGNLGARRDFTDVRDVVRAYRLLVLAGEPGAVYNVCSGTDVAISEIAGILQRLAGRSVELRPDPDLMRPIEVPVLRGDPARLTAATGWAPTIPLERTLADVLSSWRSATG